MTGDRYIAANIAEGMAAYERGNLGQAETCFSNVLSADAGNVKALHMLGVTLARLGRRENALALMERAAASEPHDADILSNCATLMKDTGRNVEAVAHFDRALAIAPDHILALYGRALSKLFLDLLLDAVSDLDQVLVLNPQYGAAWTMRGNVLRRLRRYDDALASYARAVAINSRDFVAQANLGNALADLGRDAEAIERYNASLLSQPFYPVALYNRGLAFQRQGRHDLALSDFDTILSKDFDNVHALAAAADAALKLCDWARVSHIRPKLLQAATKTPVPPFTLLSYTDDPALQLAAATAYFSSQIAQPNIRHLAVDPYSHDRVRLGYISADFGQHPVAVQAIEIFERHDRDRFEVKAFSLAEHPETAFTRRLRSAFDSFDDLANLDDAAAAQRIHALEVDILIDLNGYTQGGRPGILAMRPAPVQVSYLGFSGTMGTDAIDYLIADEICVPAESARFFKESIVYLPASFFPFSAKPDPARPLDRKIYGIAEDAFIFCCLSKAWKISEEIFRLWLRLLLAVPDSVLWLKEPAPPVRHQLISLSRAVGLEPGRIVFYPHGSYEDYLAALSSADLFLDTWPYSAHAVTSDALWSSLPVLTCQGRSFASRIAASQLQGVGLPELITETLDDYERAAIRLANDPARLARYRETLRAQRRLSPPFGFQRYVENFEQALLGLYQKGRKHSL